MAHIDVKYKEDDTLEKQFISTKMENMNLINQSEMEGMKFLQQLGECNRDSESLNQQINQIQTIIAMLQNEVSQADCEERNIGDVHEAEQRLLVQR